jgi:hypothetical protein
MVALDYQTSGSGGPEPVSGSILPTQVAQQLPIWAAQYLAIRWRYNTAVFNVLFDLLLASGENRH